MTKLISTGKSAARDEAFELESMGESEADGGRGVFFYSLIGVKALTYVAAFDRGVLPIGD